MVIMCSALGEQICMKFVLMATKETGVYISGNGISDPGSEKTVAMNHTSNSIPISTWQVQCCTSSRTKSLYIISRQFSNRNDWNPYN